MGHVVPIRGDHVAAALEARSRGSFTDMLAQFIAAMPNSKAIKAFADKHPVRWAQVGTLTHDRVEEHAATRILRVGAVDSDGFAFSSTLSKNKTLSFYVTPYHD